MEQAQTKVVDIIKFCEAYNNAVKSKQTVFVFDDQEMDTKYAYYTIEYLFDKGELKGLFNADKTVSINVNTHP